MTEGFRGDVHPLLSGHNRLDVAARWSPIRLGQALSAGYFPPVFYEPFTALRTASTQRTYGDRDFSAFLPAQVGSVGQMWSVDAERAVEFLRQWCAAASSQLIAPGRRAGPDGMFAMLRAVAPTHWDVVFRMHAEFRPEPGVFLTPSCFLGRMIVNRQTGSIDYFSLSIPHDKGLNATLTVRLETEALIDIMFVSADGLLLNKLNSFEHLRAAHSDVGHPPAGRGRSAPHSETFLEHVAEHFGL